jgi:hypothetical protein
MSGDPEAVLKGGPAEAEVAARQVNAEPWDRYQASKKENYLFCATSWRIPSMSSWMLYWCRAR